jgi:hypothetical protein
MANLEDKVASLSVEVSSIKADQSHLLVSIMNGGDSRHPFLHHGTQVSHLFLGRRRQHGTGAGHSDDGIPLRRFWKVRV